MNHLTLAVAGGRKTQSIVDHCAGASSDRRILVLTYTQQNQREIDARLSVHRPLQTEIHVQGWFSFLLNHWVRPYLPAHFAARRLRGLNFDVDPGRFAKGEARFLDSEGRAYKLHLAQLALDTNAAANGAALDRLSRMYDEIHLDEVQDLNGYDLEVLLELMRSPIDLHLVGDVRQALLLTNARDPKNKQYKGVQIKTWFDKQQAGGLLEIWRQTTTWRSNQIIADRADSVFGASFGFEKTISANEESTGHDGVFLIAPEDVSEYMVRFRPMCLRHSAASAKSLNLPFRNIALAKGSTADRVLIGPTAGVVDFLKLGAQLGDTAACSFYVALTRARFSVAIVTADAGSIDLPIWTP